MRVPPCHCPVSARLPNLLMCTRPHGASKRDPAAPPLVLHPPAALVCACTTATFARCKRLCARPHARRAKARPPNDANECERAAAADFAPPLSRRDDLHDRPCDVNVSAPALTHAIRTPGRRTNVNAPRPATDFMLPAAAAGDILLYIHFETCFVYLPL
ncbi:hypothetical protein B0H13DRAFT_2443540 [Mycena leptocephala]|nr:hypothetical protein B0H13DRAFT_2443540 [Mycena leptocephala]